MSERFRSSSDARARDGLAELLASVARADAEAFKSLYDRTSAKLFGVVLRIVRDRAVAEEVLQDAYLRIWQNATAYSPEAGRPMTWLISVARNRAIDVARRQREVRLEAEESGEDPLAALADPLDRESDILARDALSRCLGALEEAQRGMILLAYRDGYSREELAIRFDRPVNTVKTWLHRGLAALRTCLGTP